MHEIVRKSSHFQSRTFRTRISHFSWALCITGRAAIVVGFTEPKLTCEHSSDQAGIRLVANLPRWKEGPPQKSIPRLTQNPQEPRRKDRAASGVTSVKGA